jgi:DNA modification methylase
MPGELLPKGAADLTTTEGAVLARMESARVQLQEARDLRAAKQVADGAAAIREWLKRQTEVGLAIVNDASLLKLEAEAKMGEFLQQPGAVQERGRPEKTSQPGTFSAPTHKELGISRQSAQRYEQVASVPQDRLRELADAATKQGKELTREAVLKDAQKRKPQPAPAPVEPGPAFAWPALFPPAYRNRILTGDSRELSRQLPSESIAICFCDPVYDRLADYEWLAGECERLLIPGGSLVVQCGTLTRFDCEQVLRQSKLQFVDLLAEVYPYALTALWSIRVQVGWKPYLWFSNGKRTTGEWIMNRVHTGGKQEADASKAQHPWGDAADFALGILPKLCPKGGILWDPFAGSGIVPVVARALGIPFVAFEIDPAVAAQAGRRLGQAEEEQ